MFRKDKTAGPRFAAEWLIAGLGNPGEEYARHRHNVGFWVINELSRRAGTQVKNTGSLMHIGTGSLAGSTVALIKPKTFMNNSGRAIAQALQWTGCNLAHTIVIYDELDLKTGALRIRAGGGHGGHNGLKSIGSTAGLDFVRVRIGIGRPTVDGEPSWEPDVVASWVLGAPQGEDKKLLDEAVVAASDAIECLIVDGVELAATRFNRK